jgi:hypothetical protein
MVQHDDVTLGVDGETQNFAEIHVRGVFEEVGRSVEGNRRHVRALRRLRGDGHNRPDVDELDRRDGRGERTRDDEELFHGRPPWDALSYTAAGTRREVPLCRYSVPQVVQA